MKKYVSLVSVIFLFLFVIMYIFRLHLYKVQNLVSENIDINEQLTQQQESDNSINTSQNYDVEIEDDALTFYGDDGSIIVYSFENDRLDSVVQLFTTEDEKTTEYIKNVFKAQVGDGVIESVEAKENLVSVKYDMEHFKEYENYTKIQI